MRGLQKNSFIPKSVLPKSLLPKSLLKDESGQAITEYLLILSFTLVATIAMTRVILKSFDSGLLRFGGELERNLKSGRELPYVWKN